MSFNISNWIWEHSKQNNTSLLAMLALASHADENGVCYPGISRIAKKIRHKDERNTRRVLRRLHNGDKQKDILPEITIIENKGIKTSSGWTNRYLLTAYRKANNIVDEYSKYEEDFDARGGKITQQEGTFLPSQEGTIIPSHEGTFLPPKESVNLSEELSVKQSDKESILPSVVESKASLIEPEGGKDDPEMVTINDSELEALQPRQVNPAYPAELLDVWDAVIAQCEVQAGKYAKHFVSEITLKTYRDGVLTVQLPLTASTWFHRAGKRLLGRKLQFETKGVVGQLEAEFVSRDAPRAMMMVSEPTIDMQVKSLRLWISWVNAKKGMSTYEALLETMGEERLSVWLGERLATNTAKYPLKFAQAHLDRLKSDLSLAGA